MLCHLGSICREGWVNRGRHNCSLVRKPFIMLSIHGCWLRLHHITTTRYFVPHCLLKHRSVKLTKLLENRFTSYSSNDLHLWHPESSSAVTLLLHTDWMMLKNASNQGGANSVTVLSTRKLVASKGALLENYLAVSTWIFNGSSIECHEKKH